MKALKYFSIACVMLISCSKGKQENITSEMPKPVVKDEAVVIAVQPEPDTLKGSLNAMATATIGSTNVSISYHSPAVRGRVIWGGLVPYDKVWVTGAHMATSLEFDKPVIVDGKEIPAGKYALFTIPGKENWTIIINSNWEQHLADEYDEKKDILRLKVTPEIQDTPQERLRYNIEGDNNNAELGIYWERVKILVPFKTTG